MRSAVKGLFQNNWQPQLQFVRCKHKLNVTKPRLPHYERMLTEHVCRPYLYKEKKPKHIPNFESCVGQINRTIPNEDHPLKTILAKESLNWFKSSKLVAFFHLNAINPEEKFECQLLLKKNGMKFFIFNKCILQKSLTNTVFEKFLDFYCAPTATAFSQEPDVYKLLKVVKKLPKLVLMAAAVENRLLSLTELEKYGKLKNIDEAREILLSTIMTPSQGFVQKLNHHPTTLVEMLNQHKKILES